MSVKRRPIPFGSLLTSLSTRLCTPDLPQFAGRKPCLWISGDLAPRPASTSDLLPPACCLPIALHRPWVLLICAHVSCFPTLVMCFVHTHTRAHTRTHTSRRAAIGDDFEAGAGLAVRLRLVTGGPLSIYGPAGCCASPRLRCASVFRVGCVSAAMPLLLRNMAPTTLFPSPPPFVLFNCANPTQG